MRYYSYSYPTEHGYQTDTFSEKEIKTLYYEVWIRRMYSKFGEDTDKDLSFESCLEEWIIVNLAWEVDGPVESI